MSDPGMPREKPLVLVVDDDVAMRFLASASLRKAGYATEEAGNGRLALDSVCSLQPDLVLMDVMMPEMDGFTACAELRKAPGGDRIPVVMMTGLDDIESIHRAYEAGATDFITKPINWVILGYRVNYVLRANRTFLDLCRSEAKTRALLRAIPDLIFRIGRDGVLLDVVSSSDNVVTTPGVEYRGKKLSELFPPDVAEPAIRYATLALESGEIKGFEYTLPSEKGIRCFEARVVAIGEGESLYIARDITERKKAEERLAYLAYHDSLTGLPNRVTFHERLSRELARARRRKESVGVVLIDLDRFKEVNDTMGHDAGDRLLQAVADRLSGSLRETDTVARMAGDEFCVILTDQADEHTAVAAAHRVHHAFSKPFVVDGQELPVTASMGISMFPFNGDTAETLVKQADIAMFRAKAQGRDALQVFSPEMSTAVARRIEMEKGLRRAVERNEFVIHYQPEVDLRTGRIIGAESLVRWQRPGEGLIPPMQFIPLAEETGAIVPMSEWVFETSCAQAKAWQDEGFTPFRIAVNASAKLFQQYDLVATISRVLQRTGLGSESLEVEITESVAMQNMEAALDTLWKMNRIAVRVAMDDFGTGYSSLAYLKKFPIQLLKIDRAFIKDLTRNPEDQTIVQAIIAMAHTLKIEVIAEGVETVEQLDFLRANGCDEVQGFFFSKPVPADEFAAILARNRKQPA